MAVWNAEQYLRYADERGRPFFDLTARIGARQPGLVVDLGCGPGNLTRTLAERWPGARVIGVDSSAEMLAQAPAGDGLEWEQADLREWTPPGPVDVLVSNATLQWIPRYEDQLPRLVDLLADDGWLAIQVPANHDEPLHRLLRELLADPEFAPLVSGIERTRVLDARETADILLAAGCSVDAWQTTYLHLLPGEDPVFDWIAGTGARPALQALTGQPRERFVARYRAALREAYPPGPQGTWLPFPRTFVVARAGARR